jgi:hypothetical protein
MTLRLLALALLGFVLLPAGHAQDRKKDQAPPKAAKSDRMVYSVRGGEPVALAEVVTTHFHGEVVVSALPSLLVLSGDPVAIAEAAKLLDKIDRPVRAVEVELILVEMAKTDVPGMPAVADVLAKLDELGKAGATVQKIKFTATEGRPVTTESGGNRPFTTATTVRGGGPGGGGPVQRSFTYQRVGTTVKATARVAGDNAVALDLNVQDNGARPSDGADDPPTFDTVTLNTHLTVPQGQSVLAQATRKDGKASKSLTFVIVSAKVIEPKTGTKG